MIEAARRLLSASDATDIHVVEVGPGGGTAVDTLAGVMAQGLFDDSQSLHLSVLELSGVESDSLGRARKKLEDTAATTSCHKGSLTDIAQHFTKGADIVSTSAVLHEVYSYAGGYAAIDESIRGISTVLRPGGFYAYRDVYGVDNLSQHERVRHVYDRSAWVAFSQLFLEHYLDRATHPYHQYDDRIVFSQHGDAKKLDDIDRDVPLSVEAPVGVLREVQRHYVTFRDHVWRNGTLGFTPELEGELGNDWIDQQRGHKRIHYTMHENDIALKSVSTPKGGEAYIVDSDIFDETTEALMSKLLDDIIVNRDNSQHWSVWQEWLRREGSETYVYMPLNGLLGSVAIQSYEATNGESVLLPVRQSDVSIVPRTYYNRYLKKKLSNPLFDGKQLVLFESVALKDGSGIEQRKLAEEKITGALGTLSVYCSQDTLTNIYSPLRKALR